MKKIFSISACIILIIGCFTGCSSPNADMTQENITATVEIVEQSLKNFDEKKLKKYVSSSTLSTIITYSQQHEQFAELGKAIFENLSIEVSNIDIEKETVTLKIMNKDLSSTANSFTKELKDNYSSFQLLTKLNDEDFLNTKLETLLNNISQDEMITDPFEVSLKIEKRDKNLVLVFDETSEDAVSGGALSAIKNIYN